MGGYQSRPSSEGPHYPVGGVYSAHHHRYPGQYHSSYWPNIRGDVGQGYHTHQPRPPVQQQFMRMGELAELCLGIRNNNNDLPEDHSTVHAT